MSVFQVFLGFSCLWHFLVLVRYFIECPSICMCLMFFSWLEAKNPSRHIITITIWYIHIHITLLEKFTLITGLRWCLPASYTTHLPHFPFFILPSWSKSLVQPTFKWKWSNFITLCLRTDSSIRNRNPFSAKRGLLQSPLCKVSRVAQPSPGSCWGFRGARYRKGVSAT